MSFTYVSNLPAAANNPSNDQPNMQTNTNSIASLISVNHIGFNTATAGQHKQVDFPDVIAPATPTGTASVIFPKDGIADAAHAQLMFQNPNATYPISLIKAYGNITGSTGAIVQSINVASVLRNSTGLYTVTLNASVVSGTSYGLFGGYSSGIAVSGIQFSISSPTVFTVNFSGFDPTNFYFIVTQL